jgi:hypothetical protein
MFDWKKYLRERFPREHRHMMRLWRFSWRRSRLITLAAFLALSVPGAFVGFLAGKQMNNVSITNVMPTAVAPKEIASVGATDQQQQIKFLQEQLTETRRQLADAIKWIPFRDRKSVAAAGPRPSINITGMTAKDTNGVVIYKEGHSSDLNINGLETSGTKGTVLYLPESQREKSK